MVKKEKKDGERKPLPKNIYWILIGVGLAILVVVYVFNNVDLKGVEEVSGETGMVPDSVRYSLLSDDFEYFTGSEWAALGSETGVRFGSKVISGSDLKGIFEDYYYTRDLPTEISIFGVQTGLLKALDKGPLANGDVTLNSYLLFEFNGVEYALNYDDRLYKIVDGKYIKHGVSFAKVILWRNSVLDDPISVQGRYYCVQMIERNLQIDLGVQAISGADCSA